MNQESHISASYADALIYQRGIHDIEHGITYGGSNFIFHDSQGFESGAKDEIEVVWDFIEKRSAAHKLQDQLHAIWQASLLLFFVQVTDSRYFKGTVYLWTVLAPSCPQNLNSSIKE